MPRVESDHRQQVVCDEIRRFGSHGTGATSRVSRRDTSRSTNCVLGGGGIRATRRPRGWLSLGPPTRSHDAVVVLAVSCMMRCCISAHHARRRFTRRLVADVSGEGISGIATPRKGPCVTARSAVFQRWDTGVLSFFRYLVSKLAPPQSRVTIRLFLQKPKMRFRRRQDFSTAWDSRRCFTPAPSFGQACTDVCKSPSRAHRCVVVFFSFFVSFVSCHVPRHT